MLLFAQSDTPAEASKQCLRSEEHPRSVALAVGWSCRFKTEPVDDEFGLMIDYPGFAVRAA